MKRSSDRIRLIVKKVAQKYQIPRQLAFELNRVPAPSEVPLHMEELSDHEGKLQGFRISIFDEKISKNELETILQHELAHARLQGMGFLRVTGSLPLKLRGGSKAELDAINRIVGFPWEYYSSLLHAKYFPKSCREMAFQTINGFKVELDSGWPALKRLLQLLIWRTVSRRMDWKDLQENLVELISDHTNDSNKDKIDTLSKALERMPELPQDLFESSPLKAILRIMVDALNDVFKGILERPLDVPAGLPSRPTYIA